MKFLTRSFLVLSALFITNVSVSAQLPMGITISPENATGWDNITLTLDPSQTCFTNGNLVAAPVIHMHSGYTDASCNEWQNVVAFDDTGADATSPALSDNGDGTYSITFTPGTYYGLAPGTEIKAINAVFNNGSDWTEDAKDTHPDGFCTDFYIPLQTYTGDMFTETDVGITEGYQTSYWGDYDNDGDLDLLLNKSTSEIYKNNGDKTFSKISTPFDNYMRGNWIDYDNDKDLDVILGSAIYVNQGNDSFVRVFISELKEFYGGDIVLPHAADYDNDGDNDIVFAFKRFIGVLNNYKGGFLLADQNLEGKASLGNIYQPASFIDVNKDGHLDILSGRLHVNNGSNLFLMDSTFPEDIPAYYMNTGDYDDDGDIDVVYYGSTKATLLENIDGKFTDSGLDLGGIIKFCIFGDIDNNGYTDIVVGLNSSAILYLNDGSNNYSTSDIIHSVSGTRGAELGDYDNDGDLDIIIYSDNITRILENNLNTCASPPSVPTNLSHSIQGNSATLLWDPSNDSRSSSSGLSYNICIINTDSNDTIKSPEADLTTGRLRNTLPGNTGSNTFYTIKGLKSGNYSWCVQAIDNGNTASEFSAYDLFQVTLDASLSPLTNQVIIPGNAGSTLTVTETFAPGSRVWAYGSYPGGPYKNIISGETGVSYTPQFNTDGRYYIVCKSISGTDTIVSSEVYVKVVPFLDIRIPEIDPNFQQGTCISGDYDNDGDLDILLTSNQGIKIYKNTNLSFTEIPVSPDLIDGDIAWFDFNNDNQLDIIATGEHSGNNICRIFINEGSGSFSEIDHDVPGLKYGSVEAGDYDHDGDPDILICGQDIEPKTRILRNEGNGTFSDINVKINQVMDGFARWGDYNGDGRLDILMSGTDYSGNPFTGLYQNMDNDIFKEVDFPFKNLRYSFGGFGDYDNDNDLDILIGGMNNVGTWVYVYKNMGGDQFQEILISNDERYNYVDWVDYDNDGLLDIFMVGTERYSGMYAEYGRTEHIYKNLGNDIFQRISFKELDCNSNMYFCVADLDNDSDPDIFQKTYDREEVDSYFSVFQNQSFSTKTTPDPPDNLKTERRGEEVILTWDRPDNVQDESLSYDIMLGNYPDSLDILAPLSQAETGFRLVAEPGQICDTTYKITIVEQGDYYWKVQAINNSDNASTFSLEDTINIGNYFNEVSNPFFQIRYESDVDCGDYDNDGDEDIIISGMFYNSGWFGSCHIYKNLGDGVFDPTPVWRIDQTQPIPQVKWMDMDNDNDLDFVIYNQSPTGLLVYENTGNDTFIERYNVYAKRFSLGDINNDGLIDMIAGTGKINNGDFTFSYSSFQHTVRFLEDLLYDLDNDGDLDALGLTFNRECVVYENVNTGFNDILLDLPVFGGESANGIEVGDLNNDGLYDIIVTGYDEDQNKITHILKNNGNMNFTDVSTFVRGTGYGSVSLGDYDNDNDLDILLCGSSFSVVSLVYENHGEFNFEEKEYGLLGAWQGSSTWSDFDHDGDLDAIFTGTAAANYSGQSKLFRNDLNIPPASLVSPDGLVAEQYGLGIKLLWSDSLNTGVTYNVRVGTHMDSCNIVSPMADLLTGERKVNQIGNAGLLSSYIITYLPPGKYYWSVQAVNAAGRGSAWCPIDSFLITDLVADFSANEVCLGTPTQFTDLSLTSLENVNTWLWDFGDGSSSSEQHPQHIYGAHGTFDVKLLVETDSYTDSVAYTVEVKQIPGPDFSSDIVCDGQVTTFSNLSNVSGLTISECHWDFGDGHTSALMNPGSHGYLNPGDYPVALRIAADNGCSDSITKIATVGEVPVAGITVSGNPEFCTGDSVVLSNEYNPDYLYQWKIYGSNLSGADSSKYVAKSTGDYTVEVVNPVGYCTDVSDAVIVSANSIPSSPSIQIQGLTSFCKGNSAELSVGYNSDLSYQWKLDGFGVGADTNVYVATQSGSYTLDIHNSSGCSNTSSNSISITVNDQPTVPTVVVSDATSFCEGGSVNLSVEPEAGITYQWYNGVATLPGATSASLNVTETGSYKLVLTNNSGCFDETVSTSVTVNPSPEAPAIEISGLTEFCDGDSVVLSVAENQDLTYQWLFNNGATGSGIHEHIVYSSGEYSLRVSNTYECLAIASDPVIVTVNANPDIPTVNVIGEPFFCEGQSVSLSVDHELGMTYQWMDGDINVGGENTNSFVATTTGDYKLRIKNEKDCFSETQVVSVLADPAPTPPTIAYEGSLEFCDTDSVILSVSDNPNYSYEWLKNEGKVGVDSSRFVARTSGDFQVKVWNAGDCFAMSVNTISLNVHESPEIPSLNLSGGTEFCEGVTLTMSVSDPGTDSYQWMSELGEINGETGTSLTVGESGSYNVIRTAGMCSSKSEIKNVLVHSYPTTPVILTENYTLDACQEDEPVILSVELIEDNTIYQWSRNGTLISGSTGTSLTGYLEEGDYTVEATSSTCGIESEVLTIRYGEMPEKPEILAEGPNIWYLACSNDSATSYMWYLNGLLIDGAEDYLYVAGTQEGKFEVAISEEGSCYIKSDPLWLPLGTGIETDPWENLRIYPNPTPGLFTLEMDNHLMGELMIDIYNETGSKIINIKFLKETSHFMTQIDLSEQPAALYLIGLMLEEYRAERRLVVK